MVNTACASCKLTGSKASGSKLGAPALLVLLLLRRQLHPPLLRRQLLLERLPPTQVRIHLVLQVGGNQWPGRCAQTSSWVECHRGVLTQAAAWPATTLMVAWQQPSCRKSRLRPARSHCHLTCLALSAATSCRFSSSSASSSR